MTAYSITQTALLPKKPRPIVSIGAGGIVHDAHYPAYQQAGFPVAGLFDLNAERAQMMAEKFSVPAIYSSVANAVTHAPSDAVYDVAVPASAITAILEQLPNGSAVLIQKPMGETIAAAKAILDLCQRKELTAAINFQMRWAPFILAARSLIDQGAIGDIHDMEIRVTVYTPWHLWPFIHDIPNAELLYHSIHYMDLVRSFLGEPSGVYAKSLRHPKLPPMNGSRTAMLLDYGDLLRVNIETNHFHEYGLRHQESYVKWEGTQGAIKATMGLLMNYPEGEPDAFEFCILKDGKDPHWQTVQIDGTWFPHAFIGSMSSLMRYVEGSAELLPTSVEDAYKTMRVADAAIRSTNQGATQI